MLHYLFLSLVNFNNFLFQFLLLDDFIGRIAKPKSLNLSRSIFPLQFYAFFIFFLIFFYILFNLNNIIRADLFKSYRFNRRHITLTNFSNFVNLVKRFMFLSLLSIINWPLYFILLLSIYLLVGDKQLILLLLLLFLIT